MSTLLYFREHADVGRHAAADSRSFALNMLRHLKLTGCSEDWRHRHHAGPASSLVAITWVSGWLAG
jgi:hypothetical protein